LDLLFKFRPGSCSQTPLSRHTSGILLFLKNLAEEVRYLRVFIVPIDTYLAYLLSYCNFFNVKINV